MKISIDEANQFISSFLSVKSEQSQQNYMNMLSGPKSRNYVASEHVSYVFNREALTSLCDEVSANAMRIYIGADPESGEPTVLVVPCAYDEKAGSIVNLLNATKPVEQHPGKAKTFQPADTFNLAEDNIIP